MAHSKYKFTWIGHEGSDNKNLKLKFQLSNTKTGMVWAGTLCDVAFDEHTDEGLVHFSFVTPGHENSLPLSGKNHLRYYFAAALKKSLRLMMKDLCPQS